VIRFFKSPVSQFAVFVIAVLIYSLATGASAESIINEYFIDAPFPSPSASLLPSPTPEIIPAVQGAHISSESAYVVSEVIDGDTIRLSTGETLRYIGIDTPETKHPTKGKQCFGEEASTFNEELVLGRTVTLEKDISETDRYGRLLRYVWLDGVLVNQTLVAAGYAHATPYPPDVKYQNLLDATEKEAEAEGRGLWGSCLVSQ
jgi:micrococcal nuclease